MKLSQDLLSALVTKISEHREKKLNKNYVEQKPPAELVKKAKKYHSLFSQIPEQDKKKIMGYTASKYGEAEILDILHSPPEKKKVNKSEIRNEIVLFAATCKRSDEVMTKYKPELA